MSDLRILGGRIVDPAAGMERRADIGFADGRVTGIAETLPRDNANGLL
jgi:dihydroorotase-like cyclic amidohydrolase